MNNFLQKQSVQMIVTIKKASINLKFPCSIKAAVTVDNNTRSGQIHQLINNQVLFNDTIKLQTQATYNTMRGVFEQKKIMIVLYLASSNKTSFFGEAQFNLFGKSPHKIYDTIQYIDKCPHKNFKIYFSYSASILKIKQSCKTVTSNSSILSPFKEVYNSLRIHEPPKLNEQSMRIKHVEMKQEVKVKGQKNSIIDQNGAELNRSQKHSYRGFKSADKMKRQEDNSCQIDKMPLKQYKSLKKLVSQKCLNQQSPKSVGLYPKDKIQNIASSISIQQNKSAPQRVINNPNQIITKHNQLLQLEGDVNEVKKRLKQVATQAKQAERKLKRNNQQGERKNSKIQALQLTKAQLQHSVQLKEEKIKNLQSKISELNEQVQSLNSLVKNQKQQFNQRLQILKEQLAKCQERGKLSQAQRQNSIQQLNSTLNRMEQNQQKYKVLLKEKDRLFAQERQSFSKKISFNSQLLQKYQQIIKQNQIAKDSSTLEKAGLEKRNAQLELSLFHHKSQLVEAQLKIKQQAQLIHTYKQQIQHLKGEDNEKQKLKKKIALMTLNQQAMNQKMLEYERNISKMNGESKKLQDSLEQATTEKHHLQEQLQHFSKEIDMLKNYNLNANQGFQILNSMQTASNNKIIQLKQKLQNNKRKHSEQQQQIALKMGLLQKQLYDKTNQLDEASWQIYRLNNRIDQLSNSCLKLNEEIIKMSQQLFISQQKCKKMQLQQANL